MILKISMPEGLVLKTNLKDVGFLLPATLSEAKLQQKEMVMTAYQALIAAGYEFIQAAPLEDGFFEVVLVKEDRTVKLITNEPF